MRSLKFIVLVAALVFAVASSLTAAPTKLALDDVAALKAQLAARASKAHATVADADKEGRAALREGSDDAVKAVQSTEAKSGVKCKTASEGLASIDEGAAAAAEDCAKATVEAKKQQASAAANKVGA